MWSTPPLVRRIDPLGALLSALGLAALLFLPFVVFKANRIMPGEARSLIDVLPAGAAYALDGMLLVVAAVAVGVARARIRLLVALAGLAAVMLAIATAADLLTPTGSRIVRISPGAGF